MFVAINISTNLPALEECSQQKIETCFMLLVLKKKKRPFFTLFSSNTYPLQQNFIKDLFVFCVSNSSPPIP